MSKNIEELHGLFADACNRGDLAALEHLYEPDATVIERSGERTEGIEAIKQHLAQLVGMQPRMRIEGSRAYATGELALLSSHWVAEATTPDGSPVRMEFHGSELARRQPDGTWRLVLDNPWGAE
jgi:uncharacterized protein (TIGR02246 family)